MHFLLRMFVIIWWVPNSGALKGDIVQIEEDFLFGNFNLSCCHSVWGTVTGCELLSRGASYSHWVGATVTVCELLSQGGSYCNSVSNVTVWEILSQGYELLSLDLTYCHWVWANVTGCELLSQGVSYCHWVSASVTGCKLLSHFPSVGDFSCLMTLLL